MGDNFFTFNIDNFYKLFTSMGALSKGSIWDPVGTPLDPFGNPLQPFGALWDPLSAIRAS